MTRNSRCDRRFGLRSRIKGFIAGEREDKMLFRIIPATILGTQEPAPVGVVSDVEGMVILQPDGTWPDDGAASSKYKQRLKSK